MTIVNFAWLALGFIAGAVVMVVVCCMNISSDHRTIKPKQIDDRLIAKKPLKLHGESSYRCPKCSTRIPIAPHIAAYCEDCGQKFDWHGTEYYRAIWAYEDGKKVLKHY